MTQSLSRGFTLIEVLIALAIVGIALASAVHAVGIINQNNHAMQLKAIGLIAADNLLTTRRLEGIYPEPGEISQNCSQGQLKLVCKQQVFTTDNTKFRRIEIQVVEADQPERVITELSGLVVQLSP